ncbi:MAG TPA: hypothetical protein VFZ53_03905 [Polyangiaceae bacterium]
MNQTVTLLLLLSGEATAADKRALATFQARERVILALPVAGVPTPPQVHSEDVSRRAEAALDEAQTLASSLDEERALGLLAEVERELLAHPELPQAAWLMAERHHVAADIHRKQPNGAEEAARLVASARALEGPRSTRFEDAAGAPTASEDPNAPSPTRLSVRDLAPHDVLVLDGRAVVSGERVAPGRHHARVLRDSALAWSGWFDVPSGERVDKLLGVPERVACSKGDLARVTPGPRAPSAPSGVQCGRWVAVRRGVSGLEVSGCEGPRCTAFGPLLREQLPATAAAGIAPWAAAALVGAATVGAASILIATGTFERERPPPTTVSVYRGP